MNLLKNESHKKNKASVEVTISMNFIKYNEENKISNNQGISLSLQGIWTYMKNKTPFSMAHDENIMNHPQKEASTYVMKTIRINAFRPILFPPSRQN